MGLQRRIVAQADTHRLVAAIHRHQVDVDVDQQVGLGRATVDAHLFAKLGLAKLHDAVGVVPVMAVQVVGIVRVKDCPTHAPADLERFHATVERIGDDDLDIGDARLFKHFQQDREHGLAQVRPVHLGQRQRDVVDGYGDLGPRMQLRAQRLCLFGVFQCEPNGGIAVR